MLLDGDEVSWLMVMIVDGGVLRSIGCAESMGVVWMGGCGWKDVGMVATR